MIEPLLKSLAPTAAELLSIPLRGHSYPLLDLSKNNPEAGIKLADRDELWRFIGKAYLSERSKLLWGGYLEKRSTYAAGSNYETVHGPRCIHLGIDFWAAAGTEVFAPLAGTVHSFQDNAGFSNYGPTIILRHEFEGEVFHSLYGHLSRESLEGLEMGNPVAKGERIGWLGKAKENGEWPPHLHFQLIRDMGEWVGDYPGVCAEVDLGYYRGNCPDPGLLVMG